MTRVISSLEKCKINSFELVSPAIDSYLLFRVFPFVLFRKNNSEKLLQFSATSKSAHRLDFPLFYIYIFFGFFFQQLFFFLSSFLSRFFTACRPCLSISCLYNTHGLFRYYFFAFREAPLHRETRGGYCWFLCYFIYLRGARTSDINKLNLYFSNSRVLINIAIYDFSLYNFRLGKKRFYSNELVCYPISRKIGIIVVWRNLIMICRITKSIGDHKL